ncbi:MAG: transglycosylase SLT domain-containing protein, partial [Longimicrobiales bacterium]
EPDLAREWGWRSRVRAYRAAGDLSSARRLARAVSSDSLDDSAHRAEAARFAGEIALLERDTAAAIRELRRAMDLAPYATAAVDAARRLSDLRPLTPEDRGMIGRLYLRHGNLDRGIAGVDAFVKAGGGTAEERAAALLDARRALFNARRYTEAERRLLALGEASDHPAIAAEALLLAGRAQYRLGRVDAAKSTFASAARRYPGQRGTSEALFLLGDLEHDAGRLTAAREHYHAAIEAYPTGDDAARAAMRLGGIAFAAGDASGAARIFEAYRSVDESDPAYQQATYWAGRSYLALGDTALGNERLRETWTLDPASYYGLQAADRLGANWRDALAQTLEADDRTLIEATGAIRRLEILTQAGLERAAELEMDRVRRYFDARPAALCMLAETMHARDETLAAVRLGRDIARAAGAWSERVLRIVYPLPFKDLILREAERHGIDPFLAAGLIRQESLFDPRAVSGAGAIGLMQVMPRTGRALGRSEGLGNVTSRRLRTPDVNIRVGMRYLSDMLDHYSGNIPFVLAAYNAGPTRVARWRKLAEAYDADLFAERIPYAETRDYVKVVQQNARIYRALYD